MKTADELLALAGDLVYDATERLLVARSKGEWEAIPKIRQAAEALTDAADWLKGNMP